MLYSFCRRPVKVDDFLYPRDHWQGAPLAVLSMDRTRLWQLYEEDDRMRKHILFITQALSLKKKTKPTRHQSNT